MREWKRSTLSALTMHPENDLALPITGRAFPFLLGIFFFVDFPLFPESDVSTSLDPSIWPRLGLFDEPIAANFLSSLKAPTPGKLPGVIRIFAKFFGVFFQGY